MPAHFWPDRDREPHRGRRLSQNQIALIVHAGILVLAAVCVGLTALLFG